MTITAALAADLETLTAALDEPGTDIAQTLYQLALNSAAAIPTYVGLRVMVSGSDPAFTLTALADGVVAGDVRTSLQLVPPGIGDGRDGAAVALILYAGAPGTFVDLAADLAWLTGRPLTDFALDEHFTIPVGPDTATQLGASCETDQALGVLIGRGYTAQQADWQLDIQAAHAATDRHSAAHRILAKLIADDGDRPLDVY